MSLIQGITQFTDSLQKRNITFGIIGGLAVFAYGGERTTFDVDFLIDGNERTAIKEIAKNLNLNILNENAEVLQLSGVIQIDIIFANRTPTQSMLKRLRTVGNLPYPVVSAEDLIGLKIQAFTSDRAREFKDKGDILTILQNVTDLDFNKIKEYADIFSVWNEIEDIIKRI